MRYYICIYIFSLAVRAFLRRCQGHRTSAKNVGSLRALIAHESNTNMDFPYFSRDLKESQIYRIINRATYYKNKIKLNKLYEKYT